MSLNLVICYYSFGLVTYRHSVARYSLFLMIIAYFALSLAFLVDVLATLAYSYKATNVYLILAVVFAIAAFFFVSTIERIKR